MTYETKQRADELCREIAEIKDKIWSLNIRVKNASPLVQEKAKEKSRRNPLKMRLLNRSKERAKREEKKEGAEIVIFDNLGMYGTDIDVDVEIVSAIVSVYKNRLQTLEKEFAELG